MAVSRYVVEVFLSYSRKDVRIVRKLGLIIRAAGVSPWRDEESIEPGQEWRVSIVASIKRCERMLVFWCRHSMNSDEVRNEYLKAIDERKRIVPVRMDGSRLDSKLSPYEAIDVRSLTWWSHQVFIWERLIWVIGAALLLLGVIYARV